MRPLVISSLLIGALALAGCNDRKEAAAPPPAHELTATAIGHYCGMNVIEHSGPKGQILLASRKDPVWFSSARDTLSFTMLPEEPKDIRAIYVSDMGKAETWEKPGANNWIDARQALFVIESRMKGGMGADELVPFSERNAAETFVSRNGGRVVSFAEVPKDYVLGGETDATGAVPTQPETVEQSHDHAPAAPAGKGGHVH
ncbi:nitrous oxide reductase accessory protein NosL [Microvirga brassicacearum]|uniref:Copper resistance protein CopZ n=1 Tax=Microvirga brassicacearum TaxID=2580413 RepID=A0A5N3PAR4_9HYPH|nr:nitrous oxide reductase accessory protein NosL [Microvirga brassicacearum]KAB0266827.1 copper resistance protein CopZ [Microvirga brassicacearum]